MSLPHLWLEQLLMTARSGVEKIKDRVQSDDRKPAHEERDEDVIILFPDVAQSDITLPGFSLLVFAFFALKAATIMWTGQDIYSAVIYNLQHGSLFEQIGAFLMRPDFLSLFMVEQLKAFFV